MRPCCARLVVSAARQITFALRSSCEKLANAAKKNRNKRRLNCANGFRRGAARAATNGVPVNTFDDSEGGTCDSHFCLIFWHIGGAVEMTQCQQSPSRIRGRDPRCVNLPSSSLGMDLRLHESSRRDSARSCFNIK